ncbi:ABC transporter ATP-binding protein [Bacillus marinisedimentorum]|uniref:ABC transporter ATP-binding protein n=1 Tax=Bacillus marinisedimentorum TaxID=1821260 RepID=UPI0007E19328|nr:ABC transporter ATP-binding protein [Bacillus marinisedimentorum]
MISFSGVSKKYPDGTQAINSLDLTIERGEFFVFIGPSGCGKTTTMKMINRLIEPTTGIIAINGNDINSYNIHELRWNIGYVLQEIALFPHMTIAENIAVVPEMKKWSEEKIKNRVDELLEMVGLEPEIFRDRKPAELSGGQQQRIGVIRALAADPDIILMDEPFSALDPISREQLQKDISALQQEIKKTIVFVTHDIDEAMALGDRICLMREGEVVQIDSPQQLILNPASEFVSEFIGEHKSPWMTAVDVMMSESSRYIIDDTQAENSSESIVFARREDGSYSGAFSSGKPVDSPVLAHSAVLKEAVRYFKDTPYQVLPVLKNGKLAGTLSYEDLIHFLEKQSLQASGVEK